MDYQLQVITLPVSDVDKAAVSYTQRAGFTLDVAEFADPDGNTWVIQEISYCTPLGADGGQPLG